MAKRQVSVAVLLEGTEALEVRAFRLALGDVRLARIAGHVTLVPPVGVAPERLDDAVAVLHAAARTDTAFGRELGPPTSFAPVSATVHLPVDDPDGRLAALRAAVFRPPLERGDRPFVAHVTLLAGAAPDRITAACEVLAGYRGRMAVTRLSLLELHRDPSRWRPLEDVDLDGVRTVGTGPMAVVLATGTVPGPAAAALGGFDPEPLVTAAAHPAGRTGPPPVVVTARRGSEVVGVAWGVGDDEPDGVAVAADRRREGIGTLLWREWRFRRRWREAGGSPG